MNLEYSDVSSFKREQAEQIYDLGAEPLRMSADAAAWTSPTIRGDDMPWEPQSHWGKGIAADYQG